ncbi:carboxylate-amine ligase [Aeromicrobium panaciterrae]|uniref:carboxylate-amine ligase n=1 Tax=Aeromicrobium panaciterrae TaxID=363861 RepID=UPI0031E17E86
MIPTTLTLGVEEELQLIDPSTFELVSAATHVAALADHALAPRLREEVHQGVIEIVTDVCSDVATIREGLVANRIAVRDLAGRAGLAIAAAGVHPFSDWRAQVFTDTPRMGWVARELGGPAPGLTCFGLHVHVGVPDDDEAVAVINRLRPYLPHLLALSTSSPIWNGRPSGLMSTRAELRRALPRTGIPDAFASYADYRRHVDLLLRTNSIDIERRLWWDVRRSPHYPTIELRISDMPTRIEDTVALVALSQALIAHLLAEHRRGVAYDVVPTSLIEENRRRAMRFGVRCQLADFSLGTEVPFASAMDQLIRLVSDAATELGTRDELEQIRRIVSDGTSAEHQLAVHAASRDPREVVDWLLRETQRDIPHE